jgi:putative membrane protein
MNKILSLSAALAMGAAAIAVVPVDPGARAEAQRRAPMRVDMTYVAKAGSSDLYEIQSSQLALKHARRADVRQFAQMMITDHTNTTKLVTDAARSDGLSPPPPMMEPRHRTMLRQLERAGPRNFDRAYLGQQLVAHQEALALHRTRARARGGPALTRVAASAVPIVQGHLRHVRQLSRTTR